MPTLSVNHSRGSYPIDFAPAETALAVDRGFLVTDENVAEAWRHLIPTEAARLILPPGEATKSLPMLDRVLNWLAIEGARRSDVLVAFGGGVIGDLAGFAAATYMRGISYRQVPTSLLAQVDSSVGGKVGVDLEAGKNLAGAFWPPESVTIDTRLLATLPDRQFVNGAAEVWKIAWALDGDLLELLEPTPLHPDSNILAEVIRRSVALKAEVVQKDEYDRTGLRARLNFGHTIGHAVEALTGYGPVLHGEAVAIGMVAETRLAERLGIAPQGLADRVAAGLAAQSLPVELPSLNADQLIATMRRDKKVETNGLAFAFLSGPGTSKLVPDVPEEDVRQLLAGA